MATNYPSDKREFQTEKPTYPQQPYMNNNQNNINVYSNQNIQRMNNQPNQIIVNQPVQPAIIVTNANIGTSPIATTCVCCGHQITTVVETSLNICSCLLCCYTGLFLYLLIKLCLGKDLCCCDAIHRCPNCGAILGTYKDSC